MTFKQKHSVKISNDLQPKLLNGNHMYRYRDMDKS